jgi:hypothetical protein
MELTVNVPALLFPAISLLLLAFTNRFLGLSSVIRALYADYQQSPQPKIAQQIANLRKRVTLIMQMQAAGVVSLFLCVLCMFLIFFGWQRPANLVFGVSLACMLASLALSVREIRMSSDALNILLADMEDQATPGSGH